MVFVNKRSKEHIKVISIKNVQNVSMAEFVLLDNPTDKNVSFKKEEYDFREMYDTEDAINPNRSLETELALFLMTAIRKMWLYIVGS